MEEMLDRYKHTRKILRAIRTLNTDKYEREVIGGMISDCNYTIEWLGTGRRPGNRRGIERMAAYQRTRPTDPLAIQSYVSGSTSGSPANLSESERTLIKESLSILSERERDCFLLAHGEGFSFSDISRMLVISKSSVQTYVARAQKKISICLEKIV